MTFNNIADARAEYNNCINDSRIMEVALWKYSDWKNDEDASPIMEFIRE